MAPGRAAGSEDRGGRGPELPAPAGPGQVGPGRCLGAQPRPAPRSSITPHPTPFRSHSPRPTYRLRGTSQGLSLQALGRGRLPTGQAGPARDCSAGGPQTRSPVSLPGGLWLPPLPLAVERGGPQKTPPQASAGPPAALDRGGAGSKSTLLSQLFPAPSKLRGPHLKPLPPRTRPTGSEWAQGPRPRAG